MIIKEGNSTIAVRFQDGEEIFESLNILCKNYNVNSAVILSGVGMFKNLVIGYWNEKEYVKKEINKLVEIVSLEGNIGVSVTEGQTMIHLHVAVALPDYSVVGGHLVSGTFYNGEVFIEKLHNISILRKEESNGLVGLNPA
ncbi:MAG: PPC domain-containing DNA-binding protein [Caldisericaceae bacterium]